MVRSRVQSNGSFYNVAAPCEPDLGLNNDKPRRNSLSPIYFTKVWCIERNRRKFSGCLFFLSLLPFPSERLNRPPTQKQNKSFLMKNFPFCLLWILANMAAMGDQGVNCIRFSDSPHSGWGKFKTELMVVTDNPLQVLAEWSRCVWITMVVPKENIQFGFV